MVNDKSIKERGEKGQKGETGRTKPFVRADSGEKERRDGQLGGRHTKRGVIPNDTAVLLG